MLPRLLCAIILACVPLAESLNVTQLLSIPTGLILFIVVWETVGSLARHSLLVESWSGDDEKARFENVDMMASENLEEKQVNTTQPAAS